METWQQLLPAHSPLPLLPNQPLVQPDPAVPMHMPVQHELWVTDSTIT